MRSGRRWNIRRDLQIAFKHTKAAFDIGQTFVALYNMRGIEVPDVGEQDQLAVVALGLADGGLVDAVGEPVGVIVRLQVASQSRVGHRMLEAAVGTSVTGLATAFGLTGVLGIELGHEFLGQCSDHFH
jgi:hypothetical protein